MVLLAYLCLMVFVAAPILYFAFAAPWLVSGNRGAIFYLSMSVYYALLVVAILAFIVYTGNRMANRIKTK
jgi:hypothetical protein